MTPSNRESNKKLGGFYMVEELIDRDQVTEFPDGKIDNLMKKLKN